MSKANKKPETTTPNKIGADTKTIQILKSPSGRFLLSYSVGETVEHESKQADEMILAGYAVEVKK